MTVSSPSRHILARHDKAGNQPATYKDFSTILLQETSVAQVYDFDKFLCAFIFRCLHDDLSLQSLQDKIEKLERNDNLDEGQKSELGRLQKERDDSLQDYLEQCLKSVLAVANDKRITELLSQYLTSLSGIETNRYAPYVNLCNEALSLLKEENFPLRSPTSPDLQYRRLDPSVFKTNTETERVHRKPDVGKASDVVAKSLGSQLDQPPDKGVEPEFDAFLGFEEFKAIGSPSAQARDAVKEAKFTTTARRVRVRPQDKEIDEGAANAQAVADDVSESHSSTQQSFTEGLAPNMSATSASTPLATGSTSSKRKVTDNITTGGSSKKLCLGIVDGTALRKESSHWKNFDGRVQCAAYALEMLSRNPGIQHTINLLHIDDCLFIWYYDREGIVRSNGISFIADFPRALVLLALFQRFTPEDWGRNKTLDCPPTKLSFTVSLNDPLLENKYNPKDFQQLEIKCSAEDYLSPQPRCLGGRATRVLPCEAKLKKDARSAESLVVKISHPEVRRTHEGKTMKGIRNIATKYDETMTEHLPELFCYADIHGTDTGRIRSLVGEPGNGYRIMRFVVMKKLEKITTLDAPAFIRAWLDAVTCHAFLWKHGVEHGDPSLYNIMCHPTTHRGVLTDFDLSILQWEERVPGCDRMGTIPFMAYELLDDTYWAGEITRYYHHEMEAFIWCLPFMCLGGYMGGERHQAIQAWVQSSPSECYDKKLSFPLRMHKYCSSVPPGFAPCYQLANELCISAFHAHTNAPQVATPPATRSLDLWTRFLAALMLKSWWNPNSIPPTPMPKFDDAFMTPLIERLEKQRPHFDGLDDSMKSNFRETFLADFGSPTLRCKDLTMKARMKRRQEPKPRSTPPIPPPSD